MFEDIDDVTIDTSHITDADLSLIQINARLESRLETCRWWLRIALSVLVGTWLGLLLKMLDIFN